MYIVSKCVIVSFLIFEVENKEQTHAIKASFVFQNSETVLTTLTKSWNVTA